MPLCIYINKEPKYALNNVTKEYEFEQGLVEPRGKYWQPQYPILKLIEHLTIESQLSSIILWY